MYDLTVVRYVLLMAVVPLLIDACLDEPCLKVLFCPFGNEETDEGCKLCKCIDPCDNIRCPDDHRCMVIEQGAKCVPTTCRTRACHRKDKCPFGFEVDVHGCPTCDCVPWCQIEGDKECSRRADHVTCTTIGKDLACIGQFLKKPKLRNRVKQGATLVLECATKPDCGVTWFFNGGELLPNQVVEPIEGGSRVVIKDVQSGDAGTFTCAIGPWVAEGRVIVVHAVEEPATTTPHPKGVQFTTVPQDMTVREGDSFFFKCDTNEERAPRVEWTFNGGPLPDVNNIMLTQPFQLVLSFTKTQLEFAGTYTCIAGDISASAHLTVIPRETVQFMDEAPPPVKAQAGTDVTFECRSDSDPQPEVDWFRKDKRLVTSPGVDKFCDGRLKLSDVTREDEGNYLCVAKSPFGEAEMTCELVVEDLIDTSMLTNEFLGIIGENATVNVVNVRTLTIEDQINPRSNRTPFELLSLFRYPTSTALRKSLAGDIFEFSLQLIRDVVFTGGYKDYYNKITLNDVLNPEQLSILAEIAGCGEVEEEVDCNENLCYNLKFRTIDGSCNNLQRPFYGKAGSEEPRVVPTDYDPFLGLSFPKSWLPFIPYNGFPLPSARKVSSALLTTKNTPPDDENSRLVMQWGQFLDHDLSLSPLSLGIMGYGSQVNCNETCTFAPPCFPIPVPSDDARIKNADCLDFTRSSGLCMLDKNFRLTPRQQINELTSFIDGSQVYGSEKVVAERLRKLDPNRGLLVANDEPSDAGKPVLPPNDGLPIDCGNANPNNNPDRVPCFQAGDVRVNEQPGLTAIHTIFFREHNRIATELGEINPEWSGDRIYLETRKIVGAILQHTTFKEYLPIILGPTGMERLGPFTAYDPSVNPGVTNSFAVAVLRFGHTTVTPVLDRLDCRFEEIPERSILLHEAFFSPQLIVNEGGIDPILRGQYGRKNKLTVPDELMTEELNDFLFGLANRVALDLGALNIQRSRDHGTSPYNVFREHCGLKRAWTFDDLKDEISDPAVRDALKEVYKTVENVELFPGALAEDLLPGGRLGPTFTCLFADQMKRTRDGDRFWYENPGEFTSSQLAQIKQANLARIICDNGDNIENIQINPFKFAEFPDGMEGCPSDKLKRIDLRFWKDCSKSGKAMFGHEEGCELYKKQTEDEE